MAYNEYLAERVRAELKRHRVPLEEKAMMGGLCFMVRGKMCVGVDKDRLMVRLDPAVEAEALARPGAAPMDFTGRPLRGFVFVSAEGWERTADLAAWLALALDYNPRAKASKKKARSRPVPAARKRTTRD
ncbi:MAG TPA: TfoX/Sxy family protein [Lacunisphaera sp.]|nr:TfoX/Sxy family protein [Lacunisphaera sp.]